MPQQDLVNQLVDRVNDFNRRIRDLEEKVRNINARVNTLDDSLLKKTKSLSDDIQDINDDMSEIRDRIANLEVDIKEINREKRKFVTSQEIEEIENYMDLMNPINSSFMTKKEVKKLIDENNSNGGLSKEEVERIVEKKLRQKD
ncbi:hypothetical protein GKQ38_05180 [Candidatus Nanohaloarchaea archaeon]|nr:hypothetical protein GKQ38_05180 [Candidatus Nanohaloarchaea archaeon]